MGSNQETKYHPSIDIEATDNILADQINSTSTWNQRNTDCSTNSDCRDDNEISHQIKAEGLEAFLSPLQPAKDALSPTVATPKQRDLSHIWKMEAAFKNGYDSDGENQPYTGHDDNPTLNHY